MADMGLKAKIKRVKYRSYKGEIGRVAPNVIARDFKTTGINQKWATDITEYKINDEKAVEKSKKARKSERDKK